ANLGGAALERRYRSASAFVLPSVRESYGMALASALAYGLPSIACDIPATREVAGDAALLVAPGRVRPLADALRSLTTDRQLRDRERCLHDALDLLLDERGLAEDAVEHGLLLHAADDVSELRRVAVRHDGDLRDPVALHHVDRRAHRLALRDDDEPRGPHAVLHDVEHRRVHGIAREEPVLAHPFVVVDLREV